MGEVRYFRDTIEPSVLCIMIEFIQRRMKEPIREPEIRVEGVAMAALFRDRLSHNHACRVVDGRMNYIAPLNLWARRRIHTGTIYEIESDFNYLGFYEKPYRISNTMTKYACR